MARRLNAAPDRADPHLGTGTIALTVNALISAIVLLLLIRLFCGGGFGCWWRCRYW
jgi:hypothetical protein